MLPIIHSYRHTLELGTALGTVLPHSVIALVDSYLAHAEALENLILAPDGKPVDSIRNRTTLVAIQRALTSPTCDRDIIRTIFDNAAITGYTGFLNDVMNALRTELRWVVLDKVNFSGLNLSNMNFDLTSLKGASFAGANLNHASFIAADLTDVTGLTDAFGQINVNSLTILTNTGLQGSDQLDELCGKHSCVIALKGSKTKTNYLCADINGTYYLMRYEYCIQQRP